MENKNTFEGVLEKKHFLDAMRPIAKQLICTRNTVRECLTELKTNTRSIVRKNILANLDSKLDDLIDELVNDCIGYARTVSAKGDTEPVKGKKMSTPLGQNCAAGMATCGKIGYR